MSRALIQIQQRGTLKFKVDSELLRELGERLIGAPYIALGELVKNSYDADANHVRIDLDLAKHRIVVNDDGNGMDFKEFDNFWMTIGSRHKERKQTSQRLGRSMTGSKGVGRLSVQYLASEISLNSVSYKNKTIRVNAHLKWDKAVQVGNLTEAEVDYFVEKSSGFEQGTTIVLTGLKQEWQEKEVDGLAEEIWWLTPPFRGRLEDPQDQKLKFEIEFRSQKSQYIRTFEKRMHGVLDLWEAKIVGVNENGKATLAFQFKGDTAPKIQKYHIDNCQLQDGNFEIRVYHLKGKLPGGIPIAEARDYFERFGGVHVYDSGFHLPFYGDPKNDWLRVEFDHSHRLSMSQLLPKELQENQGMNYLPTLSRIYGVVNVDTSREPYLKLLVTRDRLQEGNALDQLVDFVRWSLDYYATEVARRESSSQRKNKEVEEIEVGEIRESLANYKEQMPKDVYENIVGMFNRVTEELSSKSQEMTRHASSLGSLATAGISTVAAQHEIKRQLATFEDFLNRLDAIKTADNESKRILLDLKEELGELYRRLRSTYELFSYFSDQDLTSKERMPAKRTIEKIVEQMKTLTRGISIRTSGIDKHLLLPKAAFADWCSIFQNVVLNAFNAMLDSETKLIDISSLESRKTGEILVQDTGIGVNLKEAENLFEPFVRKLQISEEMKVLGYGGTGLGLTIVRLVASNIRCLVSFVPPSSGYSTAFSIRWRELE